MDGREKLIDANELLNSIRDDYNINGAHFAMIRRHIEAASAVEAVPVVHGHWRDGCAVQNGKVVYHSIDCSECQNVFKADSRDIAEHWKSRFKLCPFCGAIMDEDAEDE